jgi:GABA(A) receptor-associated protein
MSSFKNKSLEERKKEVVNMLKKYPDKVPIILEKLKNSDIATMDKEKYLVPADMSFAQIIYTFRKRIKLEPTQALFVFIGNEMPCSNLLMSQIYEKYKSKDDGMLYGIYGPENTFG